MMVFEELDRGQPKRPSQLAGYEETDGRQQCLEGFSSTAYVKINDDRLSNNGDRNGGSKRWSLCQEEGTDITVRHQLNSPQVVVTNSLQAILSKRRHSRHRSRGGHRH